MPKNIRPNRVGRFAPDALDKQAMAIMSRTVALPEHFACFFYERVGTGPVRPLKVTGRQYQQAKTGPRKGQYVIPVKGTERTALILPFSGPHREE